MTYLVAGWKLGDVEIAGAFADNLGHIGAQLPDSSLQAGAVRVAT